VAVLMVTVAAGALAIVHYASLGSALASTGPASSTSPGGPGVHSPDTAALRKNTRPATSRYGSSSRSPRGRRAAAAGFAPNAAATAAPAFFGTLPPGARLPSGAQCARWVRARPTPRESKGMNRRFNHTAGERVAGTFLAGDAPQADRRLVPRINGDFTGTTSEILRWAACKWGISQNIVFAQAAVESWWNQTTLGDWGADASPCPPGHGLGANGRPGLCPQSYGILQNRYPFERASWPGIGKSTAMNADTAYAIWRACYDGYETWLNTVQRGSVYHAGDAWGCVGRWFAGRWHTAPAQQYIARVRQYLRERIWTQPNFQQP